MYATLIATLGFDERHVIRSLLSMGMEGVRWIVLLLPDWPMDERSLQAVKEIKRIAGLAGLRMEDVVVKHVKVEDFWSAVSTIITVFTEWYTRGSEKFILSLGGGLRALVLEAYTATLFLPKDIARRTVIRIDMEAKPASITIERSNIPLCLQPTEQEIRVLRKLLENPATLTNLSRELGIPKTTTWKILNRLQENNLVAKEENTYKITELGKTLLKIKTETQ